MLIHRARTGRWHAVVAGLLLASGLFWGGRSVAKVPAVELPAITPRVAEAKGARKVYPFSVIYGGAYSAEELARARTVDAVTARHYAGFGSSPTVQRIPKDTFMYVSYRRSDQVFWTKTKRRIPQGETVLSDGQNLARTRCGNRLSPKPQLPVAPDREPTEEALDIPDGPKASLVAGGPTPLTPDADLFVPPSPADFNLFLSPVGPVSPPFLKSGVTDGDWGRPYGFGSTPGGIRPFLGNGLVYPNGAGNSTGGSVPASAASGYGTVIPVVTPEPGTLAFLVISAVLGSPCLLRKWRNRRPAEIISTN